MNDILKQFFKRMKSISLRADEKSLIKTELMSFVDENPLPYSNNTSRHNYVKSSYIKSELIIFKRPMTALIIGLLLLGSGATSFAAEQAVPGDTLYPIKVSVNERVVDVLKVSSESKANWEARKAERRIEEVQKIIKKGQGNTDAVVTQLEKQFDVHIAKVDSILKDLEKSGDTEEALRINKKFEDTLKHQEDLLRTISNENINPGYSDEKILEHVGNTTENIAQKREDNEDNIANKENGFQEVALERLQDVKEQVIEIEKHVKEIMKDGTPVVVESLKKLGEAKLLISKGEDKFNTKGYKEAAKILKEARKVAHEAERIIDKWRLFEVKNVGLNKDGEVNFEDFKKQEKDKEVKESKEVKERKDEKDKIEKENVKERLEKDRESEKDRIEKDRENKKDRIEKEREYEKKRLERDRKSEKNRLERNKENEKHRLEI